MSLVCNIVLITVVMQKEVASIARHDHYDVEQKRSSWPRKNCVTFRQHLPNRQNSIDHDCRALESAASTSASLTMAPPK